MEQAWAKLLRLRAYFDNQDLWFALFRRSEDQTGYKSVLKTSQASTAREGFTKRPFLPLQIMKGDLEFVNLRYQPWLKTVGFETRILGAIVGLPTGQLDTIINLFPKVLIST